MRVYFTTTYEITKRIFEQGFWDMHTDEADRKGVWFAAEPLGANDGFEGDVVLCTEVPDDTFAKYKVDDPAHSWLDALIPASVLNEIGKPQVYDHPFAGMGRGELLKAEKLREEEGSVDSFLDADKFRAASKFFDEIGWQTPLILREQGTS